VVSNDGYVHLLQMGTAVVLWSQKLANRPTSATSAFASYAYPLEAGSFLLTTTEGKVERYSYTETGPTLTWSRTDITSPTGAVFLSASQKVYVGSSDGKVYEMSATDGQGLKSVSLGAAQTIGTPGIDFSVNRLHVGTLDGRLCSFSVPLP
jgi:outer membrane protein assembly factor BamB